MKKLNKFIAVAGLLLASCTYDANFRSYVLAHRASHDAMAPHYMSYVEKDMDLSPQDKETFRRRAAAEDEMIIQAEKLLGLRK